MDAWIISLTHDICEAEARSCRSCKHSTASLAALSRMEEGRKLRPEWIWKGGRIEEETPGKEKRACSKSSLRRTEEDEAEARAIQLSAFLLHPLPVSGCCVLQLRFAFSSSSRKIYFASIKSLKSEGNLSDHEHPGPPNRLRSILC